MTELRRFTIPGALPSLNDVTRANRTHWAVGAEEKREVESAIACAITSAKLTPIAGRVAVFINWYEGSRRRDPDNIAAGGMKFILDALVGAGILSGDSQRYISGISNSIFTDKANPRIEVTLVASEEVVTSSD